MGTLNYSYNGEKDFAIFKNSSDKFGWKIVGVMLQNESKKDSNTMLQFIYIYGIGIIILIIVFGMFIVRSITKDISIVVEDITKIGNGDLTVYCNVKSNDEIGTLATR
jgi:methyl-accepting chemotaxis protein